ncbi:MAG: TlpA family protein disulfide reductase [Thermoleophilaceae bacterium]
MADDRFDDLGAGRRPSAAELLAAGDEAELAAERRDRQQREGPRRPSSPYSWVVGIAFLILIIVVGVNSVPNAGEGLRGPSPGSVMPAFAAPRALGSVDADVNIKATAKEPGKTFACNVHVASALNGCDLRRRPAVVTFAGTRGANCPPQLDRVERVRRAFPGVTFVGILIRMSHSSAAALVRSHGWRFPVAYDRDGQLTNVFGIGVCPATVFAYKGGKVRSTQLGNMTEAQLRAAVRRIAG